MLKSAILSEVYPRKELKQLPASLRPLTKLQDLLVRRFRGRKTDQCLAGVPRKTGECGSAVEVEGRRGFFRLRDCSPLAVAEMGFAICQKGAVRAQEVRELYAFVV